MILTLWLTFLGLSIMLIALGLFVTEHTELSLVGFVFLFLLSMVLINNDISIKTGEVYEDIFIYGDNYTGYHWDYTYSPTPPVTDVNLFHSNRTISYVYEEIDLGGILSHTFGYWLAIASIVGFIGVLLGLKAQRF